ncbi:MAG: polyamine ABC transporter substrate-binding protein [Pseudomonadota bacterium]
MTHPSNPKTKPERRSASKRSDAATSAVSAAGRLSRRGFIAASGAALATPYIFSRPANAANGQVIVRSPGGAYDTIRQEVVYGPFEELTGIRVIPVASTAAKMMAMFRAGQVELDVLDTGDNPLLQLDRMGALLDIPYGDFKFTNPDDIFPQYLKDYMIGNFAYAQVLGYSKDVFPDGSEPKSWVDFWNADSFEGTRMLADIASGTVNLEFALIADGVPMDQLYPLDVDRGFASMTRIRDAITKFWNTGALSAQLLSDREIDMGSIWHTRISNAIKNGANLDIQWNEHMGQLQAYGIFKDAQNIEAAIQYVDFCTSPEVQSEFCARWNAGPVNRRAFDTFPEDLLSRVPGSPLLEGKGFQLDVEWWADNQQKVSDIWSKWILEG